MNKIRNVVFIFILGIIFLSFLVRADISDNCYVIEHINSTTSRLVNICNTNISIIILGPSVIINNTLIPIEELTHASTTRYLSFCEPIWKCSSWSSCNDNSKSRVCKDANNCFFEYNKPIERTSCKILIDSSLIKDENNNTIPLLIEIAILFISLIILLVLLKFFI